MIRARHRPVDSALKVISESASSRASPTWRSCWSWRRTSYYQQRQISARQTNQVANPQQQMLLKLMPGLFAAISLTFPAGLIVYFLTSNMYRIAQNAYITRRFFRADKAAAADAVRQRCRATTGQAEAGAPPRARPRRAPSRRRRPTPGRAQRRSRPPTVAPPRATGAGPCGPPAGAPQSAAHPEADAEEEEVRGI